MRERLRSAARLAWSVPSRTIGHRGTALLFFCLLDFVYGASMVLAPAETLATPAYVFLARLLPVPTWGAIWLGVGAVCLVQAFMRSDRLAFACASALKVGWGLVHLIGWIAVDLPRGYVAAAIWLAFAGFVQVISQWPEPGGER
ncbi:hypothetical protein [Nonomuraea sp. NPDC050643]|uniref:hypothetical protein n=1 Tax=Nonomuraea sp. NPDC050643 TaxID=3155660 RepID=UPI0033EF6BE6